MFCFFIGCNYLDFIFWFRFCGSFSRFNVVLGVLWVISNYLLILVFSRLRGFMYCFLFIVFFEEGGVDFFFIMVFVVLYGFVVRVLFDLNIFFRDLRLRL